MTVPRIYGVVFCMVLLIHLQNEVSATLTEHDLDDNKNPFTELVKVKATGGLCSDTDAAKKLCEGDVTNMAKSLTGYQCLDKGVCEEMYGVQVCHIFKKNDGRTKFEIQCYNVNGTDIFCRWRYPYECHPDAKWTEPKDSNKDSGDDPTFE